MKRRVHLILGIAILSLTGCADSLPDVLRDYYNVQNEVIDHMVFICDDDSAKKFNAHYKDHIRPKEETLRARIDKLNRQQVTQTDKKIFDALHLELETGRFAKEIGSIDHRYNQEVARIRRLIVKLTEDKVEEQKSQQDKTFTVDANQIWPNLCNLEKGDKFQGSAGQQGGFAAPKPQAQQQGGPPMMPGMPGMPGMMPPMGGGGAPVNNLANANLVFSITCTRVDLPGGLKGWSVARRWRNGGTTVDKLEINGVNLAPQTSS